MTMSPIGGPGAQPQPVRKPTPEEQAKANETLGEIAGATAAGALAGSIVPGVGTALGAAAGFAFGVVSNLVEGAIDSMTGGDQQAAPPGADFQGAGAAPAFDQERYDAIAQMYRDILGREPDPGIQGWMDSGKPLDQVRQEIANSPEAQAKAAAAGAAAVLATQEATKNVGQADPEIDAAFAQRDKDGDGVLKGAELQGIDGIDKPWLNPNFDEGIDGGTITKEQFAQRSNEIKQVAQPAYEAEQAAKLKEFKDFLLTDTIFKNGVNTATDGKYSDPGILKAVGDFYDAGKTKGLSDDEIKTAVKEFDKAFRAWQQDTSSPRPTPDQFLQHRYKLSVM